MKKSSIFGILASALVVLTITGALLNNLNVESGYVNVMHWNVGKGDTFYYGFDDEYNFENGSEVKAYRALWKSEIVEEKDFTSDVDTLDDLAIFSSIVIGDDVAGYSIPVPIDIYTIMDIIDLVKGNDVAVEGQVIKNFAEPSALHIVQSQIYSKLIKFTEQLPTRETTAQLIEEAPLFDDLAQLMDFVGTYVDLELPDFDFEGSNDYLPANWVWGNEFDINNEIKISEYNNVFDNVADLTSYSYQNLSYNILDGFPDPKPNPYELFINTSKLSWYASYDSNDALHQEQFGFLFPYDFQSLYNGHITGTNGFWLKIEGGNLYARQGPHLWDKDVSQYFDNTEEWKLLGSIISQNEMLKFIVNFAEKGASLSIREADSINVQTFDYIPYYIEENRTIVDVDAGLGGGNYETFNPINFHLFMMSQNSTSGVASKEYLDNFDYTLGESTPYSDNIEYWTEQDQFISAIGTALSFYHFILLPKEFNFTLVDNLLTLVQGLYGRLRPLLADSLGMSVDATPEFLFEKIDTNQTYGIRINQTVTDFLKLILLQGGYKIMLPVGDWNLAITLEYDKEFSGFKNLELQIGYPELDMIRTTSLHLVATSYDGDRYPTNPPNEYGLINMDKFKESGLLDGIINDVVSENLPLLIGVGVGVVVVSALSGWGISELTRFIRRRKGTE
jgi:hypothetical protein